MKSHFQMNRRLWMILSGAGLIARPGAAQRQGAAAPPDAALDKVLPDQLLLKDYRPKSIYKIPISEIPKPKFPAIDCHHHAPAKAQEQVDQEVKIMDASGVQASVAFPAVGQGPGYRGDVFDNVAKIYGK
jgi:hypothetical protein